MRASALAVVALVLAACGHSSRLDQAEAILSRPAAFSTGREAGVSMARVAGLLRDDGSACRRDRSRDDRRCQARAAAFGYTQVVAVAVLSCTAPGRFQARTATLRYLRAIERVGADGVLPTPPPPPLC